jgi:hypothetical protein
VGIKGISLSTPSLDDVFMKYTSVGPETKGSYRETKEARKAFERRARQGMVSTAKFVSSALTIAEMEARKIRHDSSELWMRAVQHALWLVVFGSALT